MDLTYAATPFVAWLIAGSIKFAINSVKSGILAFNQIGYGGMPSNHSSIVSSIATLIALREGIDNAMFGVSITVAFIVILDASSLRKQVGKQAAIINQITKGWASSVILRERVGHSRIEIGAGVGVGMFSAWLVDNILYHVSG